jgi:uncharacterized protein (DUF1778 family)
MGRKTISGVRKSDRPLRVRLTEEERTQIDQAAAKAGKPSSTWARDVLLKEASKRGK